MALEMTATFVDIMKTEPFTINVDGSNDSDLKEMYPLCVRIFDVNSGNLCFRLLYVFIL